MSKLNYLLRWVVVLPGSLITGFLALIPLHFILYSTLSKFAEPYPELPERCLAPLVFAGVYVWSGSRIAPTHKTETSVALFGLLMLCIGGFIFLSFAKADWFGGQVYLQNGGLGTGLSVVGAILGLLQVRKEQYGLKLISEKHPTRPRWT